MGSGVWKRALLEKFVSITTQCKNGVPFLSIFLEVKKIPEFISDAGYWISLAVCETVSSDRWSLKQCLCVCNIALG